jgi:S1-C subfamily serine protease
VNPVTTFAGAFDRATGRDPFKLPDSWLNAKDKLNLATPFNFASTNDIIGGNSGSPVFNKNLEVVGLIFDGNIQSLGGDYGFDETVNRAVAVESVALTEALEKVYGAKRVVQELKPGKGGAAAGQQ